jgi:hypothetical protein
MWKQAWTHDPEQFHSLLGQRVAELRLAYATLDRPGMLEALGAIRQFLAEVKTEPYLSSLDSAVVSAALQVARCALDVLDWDAARANLTQAKLVLEAKAARRALLGLKNRPESENWWTFLTLLGDLCWKAPRSFNGRMISFDEALAKRDQVVEQVARHLHQYPRAQEWRTRAVEQGLAWCDVKLCAWGFREHPDPYARARDAADARAPGLLSDRSRPYYWDLALALDWLGGEVSARKLRNASASRRSALRKEVGPDVPLVAYDAATRIELDYLLSKGALKLEVLARA